MDDHSATSSPGLEPDLQPGIRVVPEAVSPQPKVVAREALVELRKLARTLPQPARDEMLAALSVVSRAIPRKRPRREKNDAHVRAAMRSLILSTGRRVAESDWPDDLREMAEDVAFHKGVFDEAVRARNNSGLHSWADIGKALGVTQQAAHKRFAHGDHQ